MMSSSTKTHRLALFRALSTLVFSPSGNKKAWTKSFNFRTGISVSK